MKRTRQDPSRFLHQSVYDDDEVDDDDADSSSSEFEELPHRGEEVTDSPPPQKKHFCVICSKQFSSGKAYGGHVRIHSTEYGNKTKKMKMLKKKKKKKGKRSLVMKKDKEKETDLIRADVEGKIRCCLCGKEFQTMHSLFGHMRRHPDRSWKGIRPPTPPPNKLNLSFMDNDDDVNDDDDDAMSRSMTMCSDVSEDVQQAACCLMMLNYSNANIGTPNSEVKEKRDGEIVDMKMKMEVEVDQVNNPRDDHEAKRSLEFDLNQPYHHEDHPYSNYWN